MANNDIIVSEMTSATQINTGDLMIMTQPDAQAETGYSTKSGTVLQVSNKMLKGTNYETDLPSFTNKNVLGGMEELKGDIFNLLPVDEASGSIANFETELAAPLQSVLVNIEAMGGNGTPDNPNPINGYTEANIANTQNENIVDLFSIDSDFRGTVDFNQQANIIDGTTTESSVTITKSGGKLTTSGKATANINYLLNSFAAYSGHKYLIMNMDNVASFLTYYLLFKGDVGIYDVPKIVNLTSDITATFRLIINSGQTPDANFYPQIYDLTQMFGATIADYIYSLEQNNAGAGVAFFRSIYPDDYYSYDLGTKEIVGKETPEAVISFGQTVYGGVLDVTRGKLKPCIEYPSYNGETLSGRWLSSEATYVEGTTPPTGSQVVSLDDYGSDIDLTPEVISAIVGTNNVFADCGGVDVKFKDSIQHYIDKKIAQTQALIL